MNKFIVNKNDEDQSIFKFVKKTFSDTPITVIYKWFRKGDIKLNNKRIKQKNIVLKENDIVVVYDSNLPKSRNDNKLTNFNEILNNYKINIVYEDENIIIVNKENNIETHSKFNISMDLIVKSYLISEGKYDQNLENSFIPSHVHRLDKLTSGIMIYAKNKKSLSIFNNAIKNRNNVKKEYLLLTSKNWFLDKKITCNGYIYYDNKNKKSFFSTKINTNYNCKEAITNFTYIKNNLINAEIITGRKHQIRSTLEYLNNSVLNDFKYNGKKNNNEKMIYLTAYKISFFNFKDDFKYLNNMVFEIKPDWFVL